MIKFSPRKICRVVLCFSLACGYQAISWGAGVQYSMTMEKADQSLLLDLAAAGDRLVAVGERGHILHSQDSGESWTQARVPSVVMLTRVFFLNESLGWAVGHDGNVMHSADGGISWELQRDGLAEQVQINEQRAGRAAQQLKQLQASIATVSDEDRADLEEAISDAQWRLDNAREALEETVYAPPLMDVWFADEDHGWASGAYGTLLHTSNGGRQWQDWSWKLDNSEELHLNGVVGDSAGNLYLASEWGSVFHSATAGETWSMLETGYEGSFFGALVNPQTSSIFVYGLRGTIYRSRDYGENWDELSSAAQASLFGAAASETGSLAFVGQGGTVTVSVDDGDSFSLQAQAVRDGFHGVAVSAGGELFVTGEGGTRKLINDDSRSAGGQSNE